MTDWLSSMQQSFEYYTVDPKTWRDVNKLDTVISSTIDRDLQADTLGSAYIDMTGSIEECYVRIYLVANQNGVTERHPLGIFLIQTPSSDTDGKVKTLSADAYTPLIELKEKPVPLGFYVAKGKNVMREVFLLTEDNLRAPVVEVTFGSVLHEDFVADTDDTWITFLSDLAYYAKHEFALDEIGRVLFTPIQELASMQPVWTYTDDNSSILLPDVTLEEDLFDIPNVVEVIYSTEAGVFYGKAVNDDPNSRTSTISRGREITHRTNEALISGEPTGEKVQQYAEKLLKELSTLEQTITYSHGYCPVRIGDCVRLDYSKAGLNGVKAKVISQSIKCTPGCIVTEKAIYTTKLWR